MLSVLLNRVFNFNRFREQGSDESVPPSALFQSALLSGKPKFVSDHH
jgi:hypothetical protein